MTGLTSPERGHTWYKAVGDKLCSQGAPFYPQNRKLQPDPMVEYLFKAVVMKLASVEQNPVKLAMQVLESIDLLLQAAHRSGLPLDELWPEYMKGNPLHSALRILSGSTEPLKDDSKVGRKCWLHCPGVFRYNRPAIVTSENFGLCSVDADGKCDDPLPGLVTGVRWYDEEPKEPKPFMYLLPRKEDDK